MQQELASARAANDRRRELDALVYVALTYEKLGQFSKALEHYREALNLLPPTASLGKRAAVLYQIGDCYLLLGKHGPSLDHFSQSLALWGQAGRRDMEAQTLVQIGGVYRLLGQYGESLKSFARARELFRTLNDPGSEASVLAVMGSVALNHREILLYYDEALRLWERLRDYPNQAAMLGAVAAFYGELDDEQALQYLERARSTWELAGDRAEQAKTLLDIGLTHVWLGDQRKALESFNRALTISAFLRDAAGQAEASTRMGWTYYWAGDEQNAVTQFDNAVSLWRAAGDEAKAAVALGHLGIIYARSGQKARALDNLRRVAEAAGRMGRLHPLKPLLIYDVGLIYHLTGGQRQALDYWGQEIELYRERGDLPGEAQALFNIGLAHEARDDIETALAYYERSLEAREKVRSAARIEEFKIRLDEKSADAYQRAVILALRLRQPARAFALSERARARAFLDQVGNVRPDARKGGDPARVEREQVLLMEIKALDKQLSAESSRPQAEGSSETLAELRRRLAAKRQEYEEALTRLKLTDPQYATLRSVETLGQAEVSRLLDEQTTMLSFFVTPEGVVAFILTRDSLRAVELRAGEQELSEAVRTLRDFASLEEAPVVLTDLYARLITPLKPQLKTRVVCIIPHGILHYVPFAALTDGRRYLGDEHTLFTLPSASALALTRGRGGRRAEGLFALAQSRAEGLPLLQSAEQEARIAARLYGTKPFVGADASETAFRSAAGNYGTLLLAAHGELNSAHPLFSQIFLAPDKENDGLLQVHEVYGLNLDNVSLVVLSACETQLGPQSRGDDIVALNRAFLYAGASSVVASLWRVDDEATEVLMEEFFSRLKRGEARAAALRGAQLKTRERFSHPFYWAAFSLMGDPGLSLER